MHGVRACAHTDHISCTLTAHDPGGHAMTPREQLAHALQQARVDAGYGSHGAFAKAIRASRSVISRAENPREAVPSNDVVTRWAAATKADKAKLLEYAKRARNPRSFFAKWSDDFEQRASL